MKILYKTIQKNKKNGNDIIYNKDNEEIYEGKFINDKKEGRGKFNFEQKMNEALELFYNNTLEYEEEIFNRPVSLYFILY